MQEELDKLKEHLEIIKPILDEKGKKTKRVEKSIEFIKNNSILLPLVGINPEEYFGDLNNALNKVKAVYIHIPFCKSLCTYCDFSKMYYFSKYANKYFNSLLKEFNKKYKGEEIETIYIGGGTPSMLSLEELTKLFKITNKIKLKKDYEFTIECNVDDITLDKVKLFKENKVNRVSIGIQTFNEKTLKKMNRKHSYDSVKEKIKLLNDNGINNINIDLIYAFPGTTLNDLKKDLDLFFSLNVKHISTYSLMIEPHTMLYIKKVKNIKEELDLEMYNLICEEMKNHGFNHYEVSNFAIPGYESKHNLTYWNNEEYYGFGLAASGYIDDTRYTNTLSMDKYLANDFDGVKEELTLKDKMVYELILGMRKIKGINIEKFNNKFNRSLLENEIIKELVKKGDLIVDENYLKIPYNKIYVQNEILEELLDYE